MRTVLALACALSLSACASTGYPVEYHAEADWALAEVQRPAEVVERWGDYVIENADEDGYSYEDDLVSIVVLATEGTFRVGIENRTEHSMRIDINGASYVGPGGVSSRVAPGTSSWADMNGQHAPITAPSRAVTPITIIPTANADTSNREILPFRSGDVDCAGISELSLRLLLPLEVQGSVNEYTLRFTPRNPVRVGVEQRTHPALFGTTREVSREPC